MLHLVTQGEQPYGSVRQCCDRCGTASGPYWPGGSKDVWTDDVEEYTMSPTACSHYPISPSRSDLESIGHLTDQQKLVSVKIGVPIPVAQSIHDEHDDDPIPEEIHDPKDPNPHGD